MNRRVFRGKYANIPLSRDRLVERADIPLGACRNVASGQTMLFSQEKFMTCRFGPLAARPRSPPQFADQSVDNAHLLALGHLCIEREQDRVILRQFGFAQIVP